MRTSNINSDGRMPLPTNETFVGPLLTDMYQISMTYAYWKNNKHDDPSVFDLFFRTPPFRGEYVVFAGLEECLRFVDNFKFTEDNIRYLQSVMPHAESDFWKWLGELNCKDLKIYAVKEGTVVFPKIPLLRLEGPLAICQLIETTLLNLVNFPSLVATQAARLIEAAGPGVSCLEFGLRRAQGPDGGMSASRYSYMVGFDASSNVMAGFLHGIEVKGTHAHAFVSSFTGMHEISCDTLKGKDGTVHNFLEYVKEARKLFNFEETNDGELAAFYSYALAFPDGFLALVDTYDTIASGVPNMICVSLGLLRCGFTPRGIRLDSGDLAYLSKQARRMFIDTAQFFSDLNDRNPYKNQPWVEKVKEIIPKLNIVASNDLNEQTILSLNQQGHEINTFGIGTNLVTCQQQPALGCVYKLVEINHKPRIKLSQEVSKMTIPGRKVAYRLYDKSGNMMLDLMCKEDEHPPGVHERILCQHPFDSKKRAFASPSMVVRLHELVYDGRVVVKPPSFAEIRAYVKQNMAKLRDDIKRPLNATPYKVSLSQNLYEFLNKLWSTEAPITSLE